MSVELEEEGAEALGESPEVHNPCRGAKNGGKKLNWTECACVYVGVDCVVLRHVTPAWAFCNFECVCFLQEDKAMQMSFQGGKG